MSENKYRTDFLFPSVNGMIGAGSIFNIAGNYFDFNVSESELEADQRAIECDWGMIGNDLQLSISNQGPVPHPDIIAGYKAIIPGSGRELLDMAKDQSNHRMELENKAIGEQLSQSKTGQLFAFILALVCIILAFILGMCGHDKVAIVLGGSTVLGLVTSFIYGKYKQKESTKDKSTKTKEIIK